MIILYILCTILSVFTILYWNGMLWCCFYGLLTVFCLLIGPLVVMLINIALSSKHQTGVGTVKTLAEMDAFHNLLMVCYFIRKTVITLNNS